MIIGAGFSGLITAFILDKEPIFESAEKPVENYKPFLRFRSDAISKLTRIEFKKIHVHKGIFYQGGFHQPNIYFSNCYSKKCLKFIYSDLSIWNIDTTDYFIAPENFYYQLLDTHKKRINWKSPVNLRPHITRGEPIITTIPMPITARELDCNIEDIEFKYAPITILRYRVPQINVHQTIYFPDPQHNLFRANITGDILICEFSGNPETNFDFWKKELCVAFCLFGLELEEIGNGEQIYGNIIDIDESARKKIISELTKKHDVFSIGRLATWRNIFLDDIVNDAEKIKKLIGEAGFEKRISGI